MCNAMPCGIGEYVYANNGLRLHGHISGERCESLVFGGPSSMTWRDGSHYRGELLASSFEGHGTFQWANGDEYSGEWKQSQRRMHSTQCSTPSSGQDRRYAKSLN